MRLIHILFFCFILFLSFNLVIFVCSYSVLIGWQDSSNSTFPDGFKFGAATSAYQAEGAWNVGGKGESIWDRTVHMQPDMVIDGSNGDVACDSYHRYKEDVQLAAHLSLDFYRFSISWPRIMPSGFSNQTNEDGKQYYNNLIDELLAHGIEPMVVMFHWDLPQKLQDLGGWTNPLIEEWFGDYARVLYSLYGDRVKTWLTFNEPIAMCDMAYNTDLFAPRIVDEDRASYICNKNLLMAHAKAWRIYDQEFKPQHGGRVSIINNFIWYGSATEENQELAELAMEYCGGRYCHPIFSKKGGWPPAIEKIIAENSANQNYPRSRLPVFKQEEIEYVKGTYDFFGLNYYTSVNVSKAKPEDIIGPYPIKGVPELRAKLSSNIWAPGASTPIYPEGLRYVLNWIKNHYGDVEVIITENGMSTSGPDLEDDERIQFIHDHLEQVQLAIKDGVKVTGYTVWSLMDNFEWTAGYSGSLGLHYVNFTDPDLPRTPRKSARYYGDVIRNKSLVDPPKKIFK